MCRSSLRPGEYLLCLESRIPRAPFRTEEEHHDEVAGGGDGHWKPASKNSESTVFRRFSSCGSAGAGFERRYI